MKELPIELGTRAHDASLAGPIENRNDRQVTPTALLMLTIASYSTNAVAIAPAESSQPQAVADRADLTRLLQVDVDSSIEDAPLIPEWIAARNSHLVDGPFELRAEEQWLAVEISGATYDYRVSVAVMRNGKPVAAAEPTPCECSNEELLLFVDEAIASAVASLRQAPAERLTTEAAPRAALPIERPHEVESAVQKKRSGSVGRLGLLGYGGIGAGTVGLGMMVGGVSLALRPDQIRGEAGQLVTRSTRGAGIGLAVAGGIALAGGLGVLVLDAIRSRERTLAVAPTATHSQVGMAILGRF